MRQHGVPHNVPHDVPHNVPHALLHEAACCGIGKAIAGRSNNKIPAADMMQMSKQKQWQQFQSRLFIFFPEESMLIILVSNATSCMITTPTLYTICRYMGYFAYAAEMNRVVHISYGYM